MNSRSAFRVTRRSLWASRDVGHELAGETFNGIARIGIYGNSQNGLFESYRAKNILLVGADSATGRFDNRVSQRETCFTDALQNQLPDAARFFLGMSPDDCQCSGRSKAIAECGADFVRFRARLAGRTAYSYPIVAEIFNGQR